MRNNNNWYRLDNMAKMYPILATPRTESLYRLSVNLTEDINPELLQIALQDILPRFPSMKVKLRRGIFWYFFEENDNKPVIFKDDGIVLKKIDRKKNRHYLFRVLYYNSRLAVEFFHVISDGKGATEFVKCLTYRYLELTGKEFHMRDNILHYSDSPKPEELEDSLESNAGNISYRSMINKVRGEIKIPPTFKVPSPIYNLPGFGVIDATMDTEALLKAARSRDISITVYLSAVLLYSVYKNYKMPEIEKVLSIFIPIDLRKFYNSHTLRNFVTYSRAGIICSSSSEYELEDFIRTVEDNLKQNVNKEKFDDTLMGMSMISNFIPFRLLPLPIKYFAMKIGRMFANHTRHTVIISNLGKTYFPQETLPFIKSIGVNVNVVKNTPLSLGVATLENTTRLVFTTMLRDNVVIKEFFGILADDGISIDVESNLREDERYVL